MKIYTKEGLDKILGGITINIELEKGDKVLSDDYSKTFLIKSNSLCFKSIDCTLKDYKKGDRIKATYFGPSKGIENLSWKEYTLKKRVNN